MCNELDLLFKPIVLVTGFGPFANHPVNASWEAVKLMNKEELEDKHNIELVQLEIPVTYENVDEFVPALWETHEPKLMIHVGVSSIANNITLEMQAHRKGYQRLDYFDQCPANNTCPADGAVRIHTKLDVERLCQEYNNDSPKETAAVTSKDAGRYLCEYIYYTSLSVDNKRTLFVHVPDTNKYSSDQTARALERILELCLQQLDEASCPNDVAKTLERTTLSENGICENKI
ncbi:pyroglutamyl-peptidase 1 [Pectinophora gossypiella]|uniref:pyroglutamyl-peptidase 1 n=1 Tax=Pectinophora gossypiella TaxID=13191 RepID=UPI00214E9684|nr:pyroglutamyl-peptidase 1 [Pectinophora gossypiella]